MEFSTTYKIEVRAVDSWYSNKSAPIVSDNFKTDGYTVDPSVDAPAADLFDVAFTNTNAVDYSPFNHPVLAGTSTIDYTYNSTLQQYMATYTTNNQSFHRINYTEGSEFTNKFTQKFSLEVFYRNTDTSSERDIVSALETGGIGIEQATGGATRLWIRTGGSYKQIGSTVTNATDYYHMVFTFDGSKVTAYNNGSKVDELAVTGPVQLPANDGAHWFAIGGDANPSGNVQGSMPGDIVFTRLYSEALTQDEILRLNEQIDYRKGLTMVSTLNTYLTSTIPTKKLGASGSDLAELNDLEKEGWELMRNMKTTDTDIQSFKNAVDALTF